MGSTFSKICEELKYTKCEKCLKKYAILIEYLSFVEVTIQQGHYSETLNYLGDFVRTLGDLVSTNCISKSTRDFVLDEMRTLKNILRDRRKIATTEARIIYSEYLRLKSACTEDLFGIIPELCRKMCK